MHGLLDSSSFEEFETCESCLLGKIMKCVNRSISKLEEGIDTSLCLLMTLVYMVMSTR